MHNSTTQTMITRAFGLALLSLALAFAPEIVSKHGTVRASGPVSVADLAERLLDSVVNISTSQNLEQPGNPNFPIPEIPQGSPFQDLFKDLFPKLPNGEDKQQTPNRQPRNVQSLGSGFVIDPQGIIITNNHVIADADEISVSFSDGSKLAAELIGTDAKTDIAVLRVKPEQPLKAVQFGDSDVTRIGDWVMAIGNPFGFGSSVSLGIVSAINRDIRAGPYDAFIQTDAAINRGNSGGPLFDMDGKVVGINTAIVSPSGGSIGIGFSIPSNLAVGVIDQLVEFGETRRGWLGVQIQTVTDEIAESLGMTDARGALVGDVIDGSPAEAAKLQTGDVILKFDGKAVETLRDLPRMVAETAVGKEVAVVVLRKGKMMEIGVTLGRLEDGERAMAAQAEGEAEKAAKPASVSVLSMTLVEITVEIRDEENVDDQVTGVLITNVEEGSAAHDKGVRAGEVVVEIGQEPVNTPAEVTARIEELKQEARKNALLLVSTKGGDLRFVVIRMEE